MSVNKNNSANKIKEELQVVNEKLRIALTKIQENNTNGEQMDYCTHPSVDTEIDTLLRTAKQIEKIWYQK